MGADDGRSVVLEHREKCENIVDEIERRIKRALEYGDSQCSSCKGCAERGCPWWITARILRGEPVNECWACSEVDHTVRRGLCETCRSDDSEMTDKEKTIAAEAHRLAVECGEALEG